MMRVKAPCFGAMLSGLMLTAWADDCSTSHAASDRGRQVAVQFEWDNDYFGRTDRWFTNALRLNLNVREPDADKDVLTHWLLQATSLEPADEPALSAAQSGVCRGISLGLGHLIYTPADIRVDTPQPMDRPWAGVLYGSLARFGFKDKHYWQTELKLGTTGRASRAGHLQRWWHRVIEDDRPAGWHHQLKRRPFVQLSHMKLRRWGDGDDTNDRFGWHWGWGAALGSHRAYASVLAGGSLGWQRGRNPVFAVSNDGDLVVRDFNEQAAYRRPLAFVSVSLTAVAYNRLITGDTAAGRSDIRLRRGVAAWHAGFALPLGKSSHFQYTHTLRSAEFDSNAQGHGRRTQRWGTGALVVNFDP